MARRSRSSNRLHDTAQRSFPLPSSSPPPKPSPSFSDRYVKERDVFLGDLPLATYLETSRILTPLVLRSVVHSLDFSHFGSPAQTGRPPLHPRIFIGLIAYGLLSNRTSLRQLEYLARADLGGLFLCGGNQPDHSAIGKFLLSHQSYLTADFFLDVTRRIAADAGLRGGVTAIDGTVLQAAASAYETLKAEAAREAAEELRRQSEAAPDKTRLAAKAELAVEAANAAELRGLARAERGREPATVQVVLSEPDAVVQPLKQGGMAPSYKASLAVHESHLILGQALDPSSETVVVGSLLDQCRDAIGENPTAVPMDAGYSNEETYKECLNREVNLLVPAGREDSPGMKKQNNKGRFDKTDFTYDESTKTYHCPAGLPLPITETYFDAQGRAVTRHRSDKKKCAVCPLRAQCIEDDAATRTVLRYEVDTYKEEMAELLKHPQARREYAQRKTIVEGRIGDLKVRQGLRRFRRRGLAGVRLEFALHCLAHNLGWAVRRSLEARKARLVRARRSRARFVCANVRIGAGRRRCCQPAWSRRSLRGGSCHVHHSQRVV